MQCQSDALRIRRRLYESPYLILAIFACLYGVFFRDNGKIVLLPSGAWLLAGGLLCAAPILLKTRRGRARFAALAVMLCALLYFVFQTPYQFEAIFFFGMLLIGYVAFRWKKEGKLSPERAALLILLASMLLKMVYVLYTGCLTRQNDVSHNGTGRGHIGYIQYILEHNFRIPAMDMDPRTVYQFYHPPLHHLIAAVFVKLQLMLGQTMNDALESIQVLTLCYAGLCSVFVYAIFKELGLKGKNMLTAYALFCFSPSYILLSGAINNDALMTTLMLAALLNAVKWYKKPTAARIALTALALAGAMLSKTSGVFTAPALGLLFLIRFVKDKENRGKLFKQFALFAVIAVPLGMSYLLYTHFKYGMPFSYVWRIADTSSMYVGGYSPIERFFSFDRSQLSSVYMIMHNENRDFNIPLSVLKHSLFSEFTLTKDSVGALMWSSRLLLLSALPLTAATAVSGVRVTKEKLAKRCDGTVLWVAMQAMCLILLVFFTLFCFQYPHTCTTNVRYIMVIIPFACAALGEDSRGVTLRRLLIGAFCLFSTAQFLLLAA